MSLSKLGELIGNALSARFDKSVWVACEVQSMNVNGAGHCYLELAEYDENHVGRIASMRATIWRGLYGKLKAKFETLTSQQLTTGLKVLLSVYVKFHPLYGLSLNVVDIDPSYTLGDIERRRREIMERLQREGVAEMQKKLELPVLTKRVAVISSATAAGYGDFCNQLRDNRRGYGFKVGLFAAVMQGAEAGASIVAALEAINREVDKWDVVAVIRGGGAVGDLQSLESYEVANNIAQFPLPILTGIGHDRDQTLLDLVAHRSLRTPTAVAEFLIGRMEQAEESLLSVVDAVFAAVTRRLGSEGKLLTRLSEGLQRCLQSRLRYARLYIDEWTERHFKPRIDTRFKHEKLRLQTVETAVRLADPVQVLKRGYTLTMKNGKVVQHSADLSSGDCIITRFADGERVSIVNK